MEPNNPTPQKEPEEVEGNETRPTYADFSAEGIDIVTNSGVAEDNEFGKVDNPSLADTSKEPTHETEASMSIPREMDIEKEIPHPDLEPKIETTHAEAAKSSQEIPTVNPYMQTPIPTGKEPLETIEKKYEPVNDPSIKPLRTFKSDAEEAVKYQNVSTIDIAIAEQKKKEAQNKIEYENDKTGSPGVFVLTAILIMLVIGGGWYYWFISSQDSIEKIVVPSSVQTIIPYAKGGTVYLEPESDAIILIASKLATSNAGLGNIFTLIPTKSATSTEFAPVEDVFKDTRMPSRLARSLGQNYMVGTYTYDANSPFVIIKTTFFQNAFSGMLEWEKDIRGDLLPFIQITHPNESQIATSTLFTDAVVSNIDVRILRNESEKIILAYAFADKDTIVISTNIIAVKYILDRLLTVRTIQ